MKCFRQKTSRRKLAALALAAGAVAISSPAARADLTFLNSISSGGSGAGHVSLPNFLAIAPGGNLYISDSGNSRIDVFTPTGTFVSSFGSAGSGNGQFDQPNQLAFTPSGDLEVVDDENARVEIFDSTNSYLGSFGSSGRGDGQFFSPKGLAISSTGSSYVSDPAFGRISVFDSTNNFTGTIGVGGTGTGQLEDPVGLAVDSASNLYVADNVNDRITIFNSSGTYTNSFGSAGSSNGQFQGPEGVGVSSNGLIYVADTNNHRIQIFNPDGSFESTFGTHGGGAGQFNFPEGITPTASGIIYVVDEGNNRIVRLFDPNSWVSGTNNFTDPTQGPTTVALGSGQILGSSLTLTASMGLNATTTNINSDGVLNQTGGSLTTGALNISGQYFFNGGSTSATNITVNTGGNIVSNAAGSFNVPGTVTISGNGTTTSLQLPTGGSNTFGALRITNGQLDIQDAKVVINYGTNNPSPASTIRGYLATGYNGALWNGVGINSSKVEFVNALKGDQQLYGVAYADASDPAVANDHFMPGTLVIEPAIVGDANLDGKVNFSDFLLLASSFNLPNTSWDQGNFNYGPKTNFSDFLLLAANFNQSTSLDNAELNSIQQFAQSNGYAMQANPDGNGFNVIAVPEPASIGMIGAMAIGLLSRQKRSAKVFR